MMIAACLSTATSPAVGGFGAEEATRRLARKLCQHLLELGRRPVPAAAARCAAAENSNPNSHLSAAFENSRKKLSVLARPRAALETSFSPATTAAVWLTKAGSLRFPRIGIGAR